MKRASGSNERPGANEHGHNEAEMPEDGTFDRWPLVGHRDALLILQRMSPPETLTLCTLSDGHRLSTHKMCLIK
jgi:hypothetical protein